MFRRMSFLSAFVVLDISSSSTDFVFQQKPRLRIHSNNPYQIQSKPPRKSCKKSAPSAKHIVRSLSRWLAKEEMAPYGISCDHLVSSATCFQPFVYMSSLVIARDMPKFQVAWDSGVSGSSRSEPPSLGG